MPIIKDKKPSGLVFSLCKMSVEMDGLKEPDSSHTGAASASGALVGVHPRCPGVPPPEITLSSAGRAAAEPGEVGTQKAASEP